MKDQFVILYLPAPHIAPRLRPYTTALAQMLKKDIILLHIDDSRYKNDDMDEELLKQMQDEMNRNGGPHVAYCLLHQDTRKAIESVGALLNGVVVVAGVETDAPRRSATHPDEVLRNFANCKTAYLTVQTDAGNTPHFDNVAFSVDFHKESKEKLLWASYFARFGKSSIHTFYDDYNDQGLWAKWHNNMLFLAKFFRNLSLSYQTHKLKLGRALFPETEVLRHAVNAGCDLLIATTTDLREKDVLEYFIGTAEKRLIRNRHQLPVLFINPRDDLYVLCD